MYSASLPSPLDVGGEGRGLLAIFLREKRGCDSPTTLVGVSGNGCRGEGGVGICGSGNEKITGMRTSRETDNGQGRRKAVQKSHVLVPGQRSLTAICAVQGGYREKL